MVRATNSASTAGSPVLTSPSSDSTSLPPARFTSMTFAPLQFGMPITSSSEYSADRSTYEIRLNPGREPTASCSAMSSIWKYSRLVSAIMNVITVQLSSADVPGTTPPPPPHAVRVPTATTAAAIAPAMRAIGERVADIHASFVAVC